MIKLILITNREVQRNRKEWMEGYDFGWRHRATQAADLRILWDCIGDEFKAGRIPRFDDIDRECYRDYLLSRTREVP